MGFNALVGYGADGTSGERSMGYGNGAGETGYYEKRKLETMRMRPVRRWRPMIEMPFVRQEWEEEAAGVVGWIMGGMLARRCFAVWDGFGWWRLWRLVVWC